MCFDFFIASTILRAPNIKNSARDDAYIFYMRQTFAVPCNLGEDQKADI
jgi:hypothetical protein